MPFVDNTPDQREELAPVLIYAGRINEYVGYSLGEMPVDVPNGSFFYVIDQDECYFFNATAGEWVKVGG